MKEKEFNNTWVGWGYNQFSHLRMFKSVYNAVTIPQVVTNVGFYVAAPLAKRYGNETIEKYTQYCVVGAGLVLSPFTTVPMLAINYVGDRLLDYKWQSMSEEQKNSVLGRELHAAMMVAKQEVAFKVGEMTDKYVSEKIQEVKNKQMIANEKNKKEIKRVKEINKNIHEESNEKKISSQTKDETSIDTTAPSPNHKQSLGQAYDGETSRIVQDLTQKGYQPQVPKTKNGKVVKGKYVKVTAERAKELLAVGQTVEFKNPSLKGPDKKRWITRNNPYVAQENNVQVDKLKISGYKAQVPKTDKCGNVKPGKYRKITPNEAKELLAQGQIVEFKHWNKERPNRKIWLGGSQDKVTNVDPIKKDKLRLEEYPSNKQVHSTQKELVFSKNKADSVLITVNKKEKAAFSIRNIWPFNNTNDAEQTDEFNGNDDENDSSSESDNNVENFSDSESENESGHDSEQSEELEFIETNDNGFQDNHEIVRAELKTDNIKANLNYAEVTEKHLPSMFRQFGCRAKNITAKQAAHVLWLINGSQPKEKYNLIRQQFSFWAQKNQPELNEQVDHIVSNTYVMK